MLRRRANHATKNKKADLPLSPLIVCKNRPTVREDNPTLPSLRDRQVPEFHSIRENIMRLDLPRHKTKPRATETIVSALGECHDNDKEPCWQRKDVDQTTQTMGRSSPLATWDRMMDPATATVPVGHNGGCGRISPKKMSSDRAIRTAVASPSTAPWDGKVTARQIIISPR